MRFTIMFITAVCVLLLIKLRWPKKKSVYDVAHLYKALMSDIPTPLLEQSLRLIPQEKSIQLAGQTTFQYMHSHGQKDNSSILFR